jgi:hypothetical protein
VGALLVACSQCLTGHAGHAQLQVARNERDQLRGHAQALAGYLALQRNSEWLER